MILLKQVIHHPDNSVEATWVDEIHPAVEVPESTAPATKDWSGKIIPGKVTAAHTIPAVQVQVKCHSYHHSQMQMFRDDVAQWGGSIAEHEATIAAVEAAIVAPTAADLLQQKADQLAQAETHIKAERDQRKSGGTLVSGKWFHSDSDSRIQQLGLVMMGAAVPAVQWKTLDGSFITMTPALATGIFQATAALDMAVFANAEIHLAGVRAAADPAAYDHSAGWPATFTGL